jgi:hypothetical protein
VKLKQYKNNVGILATKERQQSSVSRIEGIWLLYINTNCPAILMNKKLGDWVKAHNVM